MRRPTRGLSIIDRYVASCFLKYFLLCTFAIIGLFLVISTFQQLKVLLKRPLGEMLQVLGWYYLCNIPVLFTKLFPAAVLIGASYSIVQMSRSNELVALKAAGVSIYRVVLPIFVCAAGLGVVSVANQEWVLPRLGPEIERFYRDEGFGENEIKDIFGFVKEEGMIYRVYSFRFRSEPRAGASGPPAEGVIDVSRAHNRLESAMFWWKNPEGAALRSLKVEHAIWAGEDTWRCFNVIETKLSGEDRQEVHQHEEYLLQTSLTPERLAARALEPGFMSVGQLLMRLRDDPSNLDFRIILHNRFGYPLSGIVLLLIGLPPVVGMERLSRNRFLGAGVSIVVVVGFWVVTFISEWLGKQGLLPLPFLAVWLPITLFAAVGIYLFDAMRT